MTGLWGPTQLLPNSRLAPYLGWAGLLLVAGLCSLGWDSTSSQYVLNYPLRGDFRRLILLSECFGYGLSVGLIIVTASVLDPRGWRVGLRLVATAYTAGLASNFAKMLVARQRPLFARLDQSALETFEGWLPVIRQSSDWGYSLQSFPSSHSATAVGLAIGLSAIYPRGRALFCGFAVLAGLQRWMSGAHFLSDVFCGAALACIVAGLIASTRFFAEVESAALPPDAS